jgi:hypothetical protein
MQRIIASLPAVDGARTTRNTGHPAGGTVPAAGGGRQL